MMQALFKYDVNTETITAGADGTITGPATDGVATAKNVADAINAAKKSSKTEITLTMVRLQMVQQVMLC